MKLEGATWRDGQLRLNDGQPATLGPSSLVWRKTDLVRRPSNTVNLPVYLNGDRVDVLFDVDLEADVDQAMVAQRGVCLTAT